MDDAANLPSDFDATLSHSADKADVTSIGPYRLIRKLGEGGMGEVWLAEQTRPFRRTVALKLVKAGMDSRAVFSRFDSERQALALMEHPNIAKVFDAASAPDGRPYFVMEYVPGLPRGLAASGHDPPKNVGLGSRYIRNHSEPRLCAASTREAEVEIRRSLEASNRVLGPEHPSTLITRDNLANVMMEQKHFAEAETMFRDTLAARRRVLGEMNPETLYSINNLSILLSLEGKLDEAEKLEFEALEKEKKVLGPNHPEIGGLYMNLAGFEAQRKHHEKSMDYLREALNHGYANYEELTTDANLSVYRDDPEFQAIAKQILARDPTRK